MTPSIVLLGNLLVDDLVFADGRTRMGQPGGAILYAALGAVLWDGRPGLVSVLGDDYPEDVLRVLQRRGGNLDGVRRLGRSGVRTWLLYEQQARRMIHRLGCPTHEEVSPRPSDIPDGWQEAPAFHIAPAPFDLQRTLMESVRARSDRFVSIDPHLPVTTETLPQWREILADADAFLVGEDELLFDDAHSNPERTLPRLVGGRLRFVIFKRGARGGILFDARHDCFHSWEGRAETVVDQTGAGDAFAAGFLCAHVEGRSIDSCLQRAVVTASFAIEAWGPEGLMAATRVEADARLDRWFGLERDR